MELSQTLGDPGNVQIEWKKIRKFLDEVVRNTSENNFIRKQSLNLLCSLTFLGKISPSLAISTLLSVEEDDDDFLLVDQLKYLFFLHEQVPEEASEAIQTLTKHTSAEVSSEAYLRLGLLKFFEAHRSQGIEEFLSKLEEAYIFFRTSTAEIENRVDADFYQTLTEFLIVSSANDAERKDTLFKKLSNILWTYSVFDIKNIAGSFYLKLYELVTHVNNITTQKLGWLDIRRQLNALFHLNYQLINLQVESHIAQNQLLGLIKEKVVGVIVEPYFRLSLQAKMTAIDERIAEVQANQPEMDFLLYIKELLSSEVSKKKDLASEHIARLSIAYPHMDKSIFEEDIATFDDVDDEFLLFKLSQKYNKNPRYHLLDSILYAASELQGGHKIVTHNEDSRNAFIASILKAQGFITKDQTRWGSSATGKTQGELDIKIEDGNGATISIIEGFILKSLEKANIDLHLKKVFKYDPNGVEQNFIVVYSEAHDFIGLWRKYLMYLPVIDFDFPIDDNMKDISNRFNIGTDIRLGLATHIRNAERINVYHVFINMHYN